MSILSRIEPYTRNGVVSLKKIKQSNYALYRTLLLKDTTPLLCGLELLNDVKMVKGKEDVEKFLRFTFGRTVDITYLRKYHLKIYKYLVSKGDIREIIKNLGFSYTYSSKELKLPDDTKSKMFHNKIYYRAKRLGISVSDLRKELGYDVIVTKEQIEELRRAGFSFKKISEYLGISRTSVWRIMND